jgi:hypothetical protein
MERQPRPRVDWEAICHGSHRNISTVIIGCEADFRRLNKLNGSLDIRTAPGRGITILVTMPASS